MRLHGGYPLVPQLLGNPGLASTGPSPLAGRVLGAGDGTRGMLCPGGLAERFACAAHPSHHSRCLLHLLPCDLNSRPIRGFAPG